jgi:hypothetical protein
MAARACCGSWGVSRSYDPYGPRGGAIRRFQHDPPVAIVRLYGSYGPYRLCAGLGLAVYSMRSSATGLTDAQGLWYGRHDMMSGVERGRGYGVLRPCSHFRQVTGLRSALTSLGLDLDGESLICHARFTAFGRRVDKGCGCDRLRFGGRRRLRTGCLFSRGCRAGRSNHRG